MTDATADPEGAAEEVPKARSKKPLLLGLVMALAGGGGGYYAVSNGLILGGGAEDAAMAADGSGTEDPAGYEGSGSYGGSAADDSSSFVDLEPVMVSLPPGSSSRHLRFRATLDVTPGKEAQVSAVTPRILDALNTYLRAVETRDLEDHTAFPRLRAQMLRRVQLVAGPEAVRNLLVTEFVLN